MFSKLYSLKT